MKKLLFSLFALIIFSCSLDNETNQSYLEMLPIESATVPQEFVRGETYEITMTYFRPTTCHAFNDIYYARDANTRTVAIVTTVFANNNCEELEEDLLERSFNFKATNEDSYIFKFWQGKNDNGEDQYLIIEVPVFD